MTGSLIHWKNEARRQDLHTPCLSHPDPFSSSIFDLALTPGCAGSFADGVAGWVVARLPHTTHRPASCAKMVRWLPACSGHCRGVCNSTGAGGRAWVSGPQRVQVAAGWPLSGPSCGWSRLISSKGRGVVLWWDDGCGPLDVPFPSSSQLP